MIFYGESFSFAIDPWAIGSALSTGWWSTKAIRSDWANLLNKCDFIYVSHNHNDHLHQLTLSKVRSDMKFYIPRFQTDSVKKILLEFGFKNIEYLHFEKVYSLNRDNDFKIVSLKSGDHREDSGIYFRYGVFDFLTLIDTNLLNFEKLPQEVTVLATNLTTGSGEFPLCFDAISDDEKLKIMKDNLDIGLIEKNKQITITRPKYFLPYGGFFEIKAIRDHTIMEKMIQHTPASYKEICNKNDAELCSVDDKTIYEFLGTQITKKTTPSASFIKVTEKEISNEISSIKGKYYAIKDDLVLDYFENSGFADKLSLYLSWTSDDFCIIDKTVSIDFSQNKPKVSFLDSFNWEQLKSEYSFDQRLNRFLYLRVRREILNQLMEQSLPWENIAAGFQMRFDRIPDIYNHSFWYHFTNKYICLSL